MSRLALLLGFAVILAGCSSGASEPTASPTPKPESKKLKVALVTPGPVSDAGWSAMAFEGLKAIEAETGAEIQNSEAGGGQIRDALRSYAQKDFNIVIGHGFEYNAEAMAIAKDFPNTFFVTSSGSETAKNVTAFRFYLEQGFYMAGYMAGLMTKSNKVAMIGGDRVPSIQSTFKGFAAGAKAANPKVEVIETFTGDGKDPVKARQATEEAIAKGADFVIHQANAAAQGVFDACKEKNVWAFGANLDQNSNASGIVIASAIIVAKPAFVGIAKDVQAGKFPEGIVLRGMQEGAIDFVLNPTLKDKVPADIVAKLDELRKKVLSGEVTVPKDEF